MTDSGKQNCQYFAPKDFQRHFPLTQSGKINSKTIANLMIANGKKM